MTKKTFIKIIFTFICTSLLLGQFNKKYYGFGLDVGSNGAGVFVTGQSMHQTEKFSLNADIRFYDIKAKEETVVYNYYYGQFESVGGISLVMVPIFMGANYYPFAGKIENNFSPFVTFRAGINITFDGKEIGSFSDRWNNADVLVSPGGFLGVGIDVITYGPTSVSTMVGLEILPLNDMADGADDYSGMLIHIAFNRRIKM